MTAILGAMLIGALTAVVVLISWSVALPGHSHFRTIQELVVQRPFLFQLSSAFLLGWCIAWRLRAAKFAIWTWVAPTLVLLIRLLVWKTSSVLDGTASSEHFFGECHRAYCADQFTVTLPFYASLIYSLAALLRTRVSLRSRLTG